MSRNTNLNIRIDSDLKKNMENILSQLGLTTTAAFNVFAKAIVRERRIPFALDLNEPNKETMKVLADAKNHKNMHGPYKTIDELWEALNAKD